MGLRTATRGSVGWCAMLGNPWSRFPVGSVVGVLCSATRGAGSLGSGERGGTQGFMSDNDDSKRT